MAGRPEVAQLAVGAAASRRQRVLDGLRDAVVSGVFAPGAQLKQDVIARDMGVSPGIVREALRQLENDGLVTHVVNRGVFVTEVSQEELFEVLLPVRLSLETYAVCRAAPSLTPAQHAELAGCVAAMAEAARSGDVARLNDADVAFHQVLMVAADAPQVLQLWNSILPRIRAQLFRMAPRHGDLAEIVAEHQLLMDVVRAGDQAVIRTTLDDHILGIARTLLGG